MRVFFFFYDSVLCAPLHFHSHSTLILKQSFKVSFNVVVILSVLFCCFFIVGLFVERCEGAYDNCSFLHLSHYLHFMLPIFLQSMMIICFGMYSLAYYSAIDVFLLYLINSMILISSLWTKSTGCVLIHVISSNLQSASVHVVDLSALYILIYIVILRYLP